jgi:N-acetylglucosaminyldiphosphoundecaprenol N-acetyl-beta-D-mannosaminyltransferase
MPDFNRPVYALLGLPFDAISSEQALARLEDARSNQNPCFLSTPNLNFLVTSISNESFRESVCHSDLSIADGMPIVWIARLLGIPIRERIAGSSLFERLKVLKNRPWRVFFFGGNQGAGMHAFLKLDHAAGIEPVGFLYPGFGSLETMSNPQLIEMINASAADLLLVSLGAVKGQAWIMENKDLLNVPVISHLGAVINFEAGLLIRSPVWIQKLGLEWLWRIKEEPMLWRRYMKDGIALAKLLILRVLPLMVIQGLCRPGSDQEIAATYRIHEGGQTISIDGPCVSENLGPLRQYFTSLGQKPCSVTIDLSKCTWFDSAACGLLMLLGSWLITKDCTLQVTGASDKVRRLLRLYGLPLRFYGGR